MSESQQNRRNTIVAAAVGAAILILLLGTCAFQVSVSELALVSTLGRPGVPIERPGLHAKAPWPFQRVYRFDRRIQFFRGEYREVLTGDNLNLIVRLSAAWEINDAAKFYETVGFQTADGTRLLASLVDRHAAAIVTEYSLADFVTSAVDEESPLLGLEHRLEEAVSTEASQYGIGIRTVLFEHLGLPDSISKAVFARMIADREKLTTQIRSEGERDARLIRTEADSRKAEIVSKAEAEAIRIRGEGESEALKHLEVYKEDPEFALFLRKLETLEATLKNKTTLILDRDVPPYDLLRSGGAHGPEGSEGR